MEKAEYEKNYHFEDTNWWYVGVFKIYQSFMEHYVFPRLPAKAKILDVGCGTGKMLAYLRKQLPHAQIIGTDMSAEAIKYAKLKAKNVTLLKKSIEQFNFPDNSFDFITFVGVIEHIKEDAAALRQLHKILKPGGRLLFLTSAYQFLWSEHDAANHHYRRYTKKQLNSLFIKNNFRVIKMSYASFFIFPPAFGVRMLEHAFHRTIGSNPERDLVEVPGFLNTFLISLYKAEAFLLSSFNLPFGVDIIGVIEKRT